MRFLMFSVVAIALGIGFGYSVKGWFANTVEESFDDQAVDHSGPSRTSGATIIVVGGNIVDIGEINNYQTYKHLFKVANGGDKPLTVDLIDNDLQFELVGNVSWPVTIAPQAQFQISAQWSIPASVDTFSKYIRVKCNDETLPELDLKVTGAVRKIISVQPTAVTTTDEIQVARVFGLRTAGLKIEKFNFIDDRLDEWIDVTVNQIEPDNKAVLENALSGAEFSFKVKKQPPTEMRGVLLVKTSLKDADEIRIPVTIPAG